ncbi:sensor histidine kinase [Phytoactinopolyspora halotolerans]|uniref:histidine kinase n=1 Tax=Phytoactinopolyspora halotolerans TaxID=1981512 RepID=A0A6L9SBL0_9ACTN|nr:histidine kinase [Phytoactinopolyspora halotolerans]NEE01931.1 two-component sensor histidine kinase [Phytoactinopolyspora halotolerans]
MAMRTLLAPLTSGSTYRRGVHLLLGGVVALPYVLLALAFVQMYRNGSSLVVIALLLAVAAVIAGAPAFLRATRTLEIAAARLLLGVDVPDVPGERIAPETRLRGALWFAVHLVAGGGVMLALLIAMPLAFVFILAQLGIGEETLDGFQVGPLDGDDTVWLSLLGLAMLVALGYVVAGLGALAAMMAPVLMGPSPDERIAALEAEADQLAERNRLARELHDSVGHALTVTTLQAAAARELLDSDPEFVRRALSAVEETGRAAMADLDHVLGLLREDGRADTAQARKLTDLDRLIDDVRAGGTDVAADVTGPVAQMPAVVSREGFRIVQEGLTNATRHAGGAPVSVHVEVGSTTLAIDVVNPVRGDASAGPGTPRQGGRGLAGMRERVALLGGRMSAGQNDGMWKVSVRLPLGGRRGRSGA